VRGTPKFEAGRVIAMVFWILAFLVLLLIIGLAIAAVIVLAMLPGKIARRRNHPQAEAINVLSWLGILSFGVLWVVAMTWAYIRPLARPEPELEAGANQPLADGIRATRASLQDRS
jgi:uncharacterized BrkB/YihY/UPF0761 family membrane protein